MDLEGRNCVKILWEVKNVRPVDGYKIENSTRCTFPLECLQKTQWVLEMCTVSDYVFIFLTRSFKDEGPQSLKLHYDIRLITTSTGMKWEKEVRGVKDFQKRVRQGYYLTLGEKKELLNPLTGIFFKDFLKVSVHLRPTQFSLRLPISLHLSSEAGDSVDHNHLSSPVIGDNVGTSTDESLQSLARDLSNSLDDNQFSDFELRCGGQTFPVHKVVLSVRSPVFKALLTAEMVESSENAVDVPDFTPDTVRRLIRFMYSAGSVANLDESAAVDLYAAADKYEVLELRDLCSRVMVSGLSSQSVPIVLRLSDRHSDNHLKEKVISFVRENQDCVLHSPEWRSFMEEDPVLALEVSHDLNTKKRRCSAF